MIEVDVNLIYTYPKNKYDQYLNTYPCDKTTATTTKMGLNTCHRPIKE